MLAFLAWNKSAFSLPDFLLYRHRHCYRDILAHFAGNVATHSLLLSGIFDNIATHSLFYRLALFMRDFLGDCPALGFWLIPALFPGYYSIHRPVHRATYFPGHISTDRLGHSAALLPGNLATGRGCWCSVSIERRGCWCSVSINSCDRGGCRCSVFIFRLTNIFPDGPTFFFFLLFTFFLVNCLALGFLIKNSFNRNINIYLLGIT